MFAKSPVGAWFIAAIYNIIMYFVYFAALLGLQTQYAFQDLDAMHPKVYFPLALVSPMVSLERAFTVGLGQFGTLCYGHSHGSLLLYGGPILYLAIQCILLFSLLLWWDSSFPRPSLLRRSYKAKYDSEHEMRSGDLMEELQRLSSKSTDLKIQSVTKLFGKNIAVDDVTFAVQTSEIFALLGPNGGKLPKPSARAQAASRLSL
jgi:ATP-binding cassette subfamily A (ABC1) protein 3